ncbi:MAG: hypothetical protein A3D95_09945 [Betaproteobacteria bacterium RIFCSPHIGHO2_12_FULL_69_13]|nr:MAG: hypothetical protein A3D95_09945 [Betaproteobacteria bacterium RIFCSPHIGHO2_12_FULL_69_13]OGA68695.1 MAG: hypothetical protein A3G83_13555 [Betaproteobacteria bacterium RIFCSPLOWO2_12_FULL_68_20]
MPPTRNLVWSKERIEMLSKQEIQQLRANAESLGAQDVLAMCDAALRGSPRSGSGKGGAPGKNGKARRLISRIRAFEARGVYLQDQRTSWGGVRKSDGMVVMSLWADAVKSRDGGCGYLLWAPNVEGSRPWSDSPGGRERLKHCQTGLERSSPSEGLLVFGERLDGFLPEDKARSVHGVDPETVLHFKVEKHGEEYWAVWGKKL